MSAPDPLCVKNPATGEMIAEIPCGAAAEVDAAVARARAAQPAWARAAVPRAGARAAAVRAGAARRRPSSSTTLVAENGKTRYEAEAFELFYTLELTRYYTGRAGRRALADDCATR